VCKEKVIQNNLQLCVWLTGHKADTLCGTAGPISVIPTPFGDFHSDIQIVWTD